MMTDEAVLVAVIDDDPEVRKALSRLLRATGHRVEAYESAEHFLDRSADPCPDCLLLDINLEGMSGFDLYDRLPRGERPSGVVFITGRRDAVLEELQRRAPGSICLFKPFEDTVLLDAVREAVHGV